MLATNIRDYDALLMNKPPYSPPYIHKTDMGQRVSFQKWNWFWDNYILVQYFIEDDKALKISKFEYEYRAVCREELTNLFISNGCSNVMWKFPEETDFYQPIAIEKK